MRTEIGPPDYHLPAYSDIPKGRVLHPGHPAGTMLGPVLALVSWTRWDETRNGTFYEREFCSAIMPFASDFDDDVCYVNVWTSHNKESRKSGILYATLLPLDDRHEDIFTALRYYFCETFADKLMVTHEVLQERYETFR